MIQGYALDNHDRINENRMIATSIMLPAKVKGTIDTLIQEGFIQHQSTYIRELIVSDLEERYANYFNPGELR